MEKDNETKYFAVSANNVMWMLVLILLFCMSIFVYMNHEINLSQRNFSAAMINANNELGNLKIKLATMKSEVEWNEDQLVELQQWKNKAYHDLITGGKLNGK